MAIQQSYWHASSAELNFSAIADGIEAEVVVVGGGITGLSAAYFLKQSGKKVVVIEKGKIGSGTSGSTTGKVTSQHNLIYAKLKTHHGIETARTYGQANQTAIEQIDKIIAKEKIECSWQRDDNFVYSTNPEMINSLKEEVETAKECGLPATFETSSPLPLEIAGAVRFANQAKFHSRNYLLGLAKEIAGEGSFVFEQSRATGFSDGQPCEVTANGVKIRAQQVIIATNVPTLPLIARGSYCLLEYPLQTYLIAFKAQPKLAGMYISPDKNHYSILPIFTGNEQLLLVGGEGHIPGTRFDVDSRYQRLEAYAQKHFGLSKADYRWSARDNLAYDDIPLVGKLYPWSTYFYTATAFMKWGMTNGTVAGMILRDLICGNNNNWAAIFDSLRLSPIKAIPRVAGNYMKP